MRLQRELDFALDIAERAGALLLERLDGVLDIQSKSSPLDLVTDADRASEELICSAIGREFPDHEIISEETERERQDRPWQWVVDPLDGTVNFAHGLREFCVSIALLENGRPALGVVLHPAGRETFWAAAGEGAFLNGLPIRVSSEQRLERSLLATGFPYDIRDARQTNLDNFIKFSACSQAVRRIGSAALDLAWVAAGRFDGFWELKLKVWDMAAGVLLVSEAGGRVSGFDGKPLDLFVPYVVASNGLIHDRMLELLASDLPPELVGLLLGK